MRSFELPSMPTHSLRVDSSMPGSMRESVRSVIYHALTSKPAKPIVFSWAPAYDHELTIWETTCGISVLYKSRYPADGAPKRTDGKD